MKIIHTNKIRLKARKSIQKVDYVTGSAFDRFRRDDTRKFPENLNENERSWLDD